MICKNQKLSYIFQSGNFRRTVFGEETEFSRKNKSGFLPERIEIMEPFSGNSVKRGW